MYSVLTKMACLRFGGRSLACLSRSVGCPVGAKYSTPSSLVPDKEVTTHTGQKFEVDDYRRSRFLAGPKLVNERFAIDLVKEDPVVVCTQRVVVSDSGGPLGHPRVFINLDQPEVHTCGYSGRRFVLKKYYDAKAMGPCITYEQYLKQIGHDD